MNRHTDPPAYRTDDSYLRDPSYQADVRAYKSRLRPIIARIEAEMAREAAQAEAERAGQEGGR